MSWLGYETVYCPLIFLMKLKKKKRRRHNGILLIRERGKSFGDESNENLEKHTNKQIKTNKQKTVFS